jgi:hypothetical protein
LIYVPDEPEEECAMQRKNSPTNDSSDFNVFD